jgi:uncharacterized protein YcfJ
MLKIGLFAALVVSLTGCTEQEHRAAGGALVGAGTGAVIGGIANGGRGALVGTAIGGAAGATVGAATAPRECWSHDRWGNRIQVRC